MKAIPGSFIFSTKLVIYMHHLKKPRLNTKPWITSGLMKSMKVRDNLYKKWLIIRNDVSLNKYKLYCNKIAPINKIYRVRFYNDILSLLSNMDSDQGSQLLIV